MPRKALIFAFLLGWFLSMVISPASLLGMVRSKTQKSA